MESHLPRQHLPLAGRSCPSLGHGVTGGDSRESTQILLASPLPHGLGAWEDNYT